MLNHPKKMVIRFNVPWLLFAAKRKSSTAGWKTRFIHNTGITARKSQLLLFSRKRNKGSGLYAVKLGYNKQLVTDQICSLWPGFVINGLFYIVKWSFGTDFLVRYSRVFVITEYHCMCTILRIVSYTSLFMRQQEQLVVYRKG
jgi:hypothetical protein